MVVYASNLRKHGMKISVVGGGGRVGLPLSLVLASAGHQVVVIDSNDKRISGLNAIRYILQNIPYNDKNEKVLDKSFPEALTVLKPPTDEKR